MKKKLFIIFLTCTPLISYASFTFPKIQISGFYGYTETSGFLQIPGGGRPGTSSVERPTFSELGINHANLLDGNVGLNWQRFRIYGNFQYQQPEGNSLLTQNLISHSEFIPADTSIHTQTKFDLYQAGMSYQFSYFHNQLALYPLIELAILDFDYGFQTPAVNSDRHFVQVTPRMGVGLKYHLNPKLMIAVQAASSITGLRDLSIQTAETKMYYTLLKQKRLSTKLFAGIVYQRISFEDKQTFPNHIQLTNWPMGVIGIQFKF